MLVFQQQQKLQINELNYSLINSYSMIQLLISLKYHYSLDLQIFKMEIFLFELVLFFSRIYFDIETRLRRILIMASMHRTIIYNRFNI